MLSLLSWDQIQPILVGNFPCRFAAGTGLVKKRLGLGFKSLYCPLKCRAWNLNLFDLPRGAGLDLFAFSASGDTLSTSTALIQSYQNE